jgi:hypothetical protein
MAEQPDVGRSPLAAEAIARIDATQLPVRERHHLRLIAHCLACFQEMAHPADQGTLPTPDQQRRWIRQQPQLRDEPDFAELLLQQFSSAARQLEQLADQRQLSPLALSLEDLIAEAERVHRLRSSWLVETPVRDAP